MAMEQGNGHAASIHAWEQPSATKPPHQNCAFERKLALQGDVPLRRDWPQIGTCLPICTRARWSARTCVDLCCEKRTNVHRAQNFYKKPCLYQVAAGARLAPAKGLASFSACVTTTHGLILAASRWHLRCFQTAVPHNRAPNAIQQMREQTQ